MAAKRKASKRTPKLPQFEVGWLPVPAGEFTPAAARRWLARDFPRLQDLVMEVTQHAKPSEAESAAMLAYHVKTAVEACAEAIDSGRPVSIGSDLAPQPADGCPFWEPASAIANVLRIAARCDADALPHVAPALEQLADALHGYATRATRNHRAAHTREVTPRSELEERIHALRAEADQLERQAKAREDELLERIEPLLQEAVAPLRAKAEAAAYESRVIEHRHFSGPDPGKPPEGYQPREAA